MREIGAIAGLQQQLASAAPQAYWLVTAGTALLAIGLLLSGFRRLHRARLMENMPTSRVSSAAQGYVELEGHARLLPGPLITSPLSGERCCWWEFHVEQKETRVVNGQRRTEWVTVERERSEELFVLADRSGDCIVDPYGATVTPSLRRCWHGYHPRPQSVPRHSPWFSLGDYRYTELQIRYGDVLYALGHFESQTALRADDERTDVTARLSQWKRDQRSLLQRFDSNGDGAIDMAEWEMARRAAVAEVRAEHVEHTVQTDLHVLRKPPDGRNYLLSTLSEAQMTRRDRRHGVLMISAGLLAFAAVLLALRARGYL